MALSFDKVAKVITVLAPDTEITIQNLLNSIREYEDELTSLDIPKIASCAGKEPLGGGVVVGLTLTLLDDWQVAFEARSGPDYIQCTVSGGNIVAENVLGSIAPTAFTQVLVTASSSATQADLADIQYSAFNGGVSYNELNGYSGTGSVTLTDGSSANIGTPRAPSDNAYDARTIATIRGFTKGYIIEDMVVPEYELDGVTPFAVYGFTFQGSGKDRTIITLPEITDAYKNIYLDAFVTGYLDGYNTLNGCFIENLHYIKGYIELCVLSDEGSLILSGSERTSILSCFSGPEGAWIDFGGSGQPLIVGDHSGSLILTNKSGPETAKIGLKDGDVKIDLTTVINGLIVVGGVGRVTDYATDLEIVSGTYGSLVVQNDAMNRGNISQAVWDELIGEHLLPNTMGHQMYHQAYDGTVHIDVINGTAGTAFPTGTTHQPCDNLADALTISTTHFLTLIHVVGDLVIDGEDITGRTIGADSSVGNTVTITSMVNTGTCYFKDLTVSGALSGGTRFTTCVLGALTGFDGGAKNSLLTGDITITGSGANYFTECDTYVTGFVPKDISIGANYLNLIKCRGAFQLSDYTGTGVITCDFVAGTCDINSSCVSGMMVISGLCSLTDNSGVGCTVIDGTITERGTADAVWEYDRDA